MKHPLHIYTDGTIAEYLRIPKDTPSFIEYYIQRIMNFFSYKKGIRPALNAITNLGIDKSLPVEEHKFIRFTNTVCLLTLFGILAYVPFSILYDNFFLAGLEMLDAFCITFVFWLNAKKHYTAAKFSYLVLANLFIMGNACYIGKESNEQNYYLILNIIPFLLFRLSDRSKIVTGIIITIGSYALCQVISPFFTAYNLPLEKQLYEREMNMVMNFILFTAAFYILAKNNADIEHNLNSFNSKLKQQADELKRSNEDLSDFANMISHDLKMPVRNISSFLELLDKRHGQNLQPEAKEFVNYSVTGSRNLVRLIDDLLAYAKVGRNLPTPMPVDTNELLKALKFEIEGKAECQNSGLVINGELPVLNGVHSTMIYHVFQNLAMNALKFNKNQNPRVAIEAHEEDGFYRFSVADNGIGIPMEFSTKLFHMFKRLHTEEEYQGTGMGLAICKKIVTFYGGSIWFESEAGKGTTFHFTIPRKQEEMAMAA